MNSSISCCLLLLPARSESIRLTFLFCHSQKQSNSQTTTSTPSAASSNTSTPANTTHANSTVQPVAVSSAIQANQSWTSQANNCSNMLKSTLSHLSCKCRPSVLSRIRRSIVSILQPRARLRTLGLCMLTRRRRMLLLGGPWLAFGRRGVMCCGSRRRRSSDLCVWVCCWPVFLSVLLTELGAQNRVSSVRFRCSYQGVGGEVCKRRE